MKITIILDMDGTIADLYNVENWLSKLRMFDPSPYAQARLMVDNLSETIKNARNSGICIKVVSWLSKDSNNEYDNEVRKTKKEWLFKHNLFLDSVRIVPYGKEKAYYRDKENLNILIDDNEEVRNSFSKFDNCIAINPNKVNICTFIQSLI